MSRGGPAPAKGPDIPAGKEKVETAKKAVVTVAVLGFLGALAKKSFDAVKALSGMSGTSKEKKQQLVKYQEEAKKLSRDSDVLAQQAEKITANIDKLIAHLDKQIQMDQAYDAMRQELVALYKNRGYALRFMEDYGPQEEGVYRRVEVGLVNRTNSGYESRFIEMSAERDTPFQVLRGANTDVNAPMDGLLAGLEESLNLGIDKEATMATADSFTHVQKGAERNLPGFDAAHIKFADGNTEIRLSKKRWGLSEELQAAVQHKDVVRSQGNDWVVTLDASLITDAAHAPPHLSGKVSDGILFADNKDQYAGTMQNFGEGLIFKFPEGTGLQAAEFVDLGKVA